VCSWNNKDFLNNIEKVHFCRRNLLFVCFIKFFAICIFKFSSYTNFPHSTSKGWECLWRSVSVQVYVVYLPSQNR